MSTTATDQPPLCLFSLSAGSSTLGGHSLVRKLELTARKGFHFVELFQDDLTAFVQSEEFTKFYDRAHVVTPPLSPERSFAEDETVVTYNAFGRCTAAELHREVAAATYLGHLCKSLGLQVASLQPLRDFEGWANEDDRVEARRRAVSRFEVMHALGTDMMFICSNCQPAERLVDAGVYSERAGADLAELAERAQAWSPLEAIMSWRKRGMVDPIEMMTRAVADGDPSLTSSFRHPRLTAPLSPPISRGSSFSVGGASYGAQVATQAEPTGPAQTSAVPLGAYRQPSSPSFTSRRIPARQSIKIGYEALSWGTHVDVWRTAWAVVRAASHPQVGIVLDSFNTVAREWADPCSPTGIAQPEARAHEALRESIRAMSAELEADKIFFLQIADAQRMPRPLRPSPNEDEPRPSRMIWSRSHRLFPLEVERGAFLPILDFVRTVKAIGYRGPWSVEVFADSMHERHDSVPAEHVERGYRSLERLIAAVDEAQ